MSVIQSPTNVPINNLPPPTSSSTTQTFTDVNGEQWVARSTIASGAWKRARDGCFAVAYRAAAYTMPTALTVIPYDTVINDNYGMYVGSPNYGFALCCQGWWLCQASIRGNSNASGQYLQGSIQYNGVAASSDNVLTTVAAGLMWRTQCLLYMPAGTVIRLAAYESAAIAITAGAFNRLEVMYLGSG